jgi:hypothetical protein
LTFFARQGDDIFFLRHGSLSLELLPLVIPQFSHD